MVHVCSSLAPLSQSGVRSLSYICLRIFCMSLSPYTCSYMCDIRLFVRRKNVLCRIVKMASVYHQVPLYKCLNFPLHGSNSILCIEDRHWRKTSKTRIALTFWFKLCNSIYWNQRELWSCHCAYDGYLENRDIWEFAAELDIFRRENLSECCSQYYRSLPKRDISSKTKSACSFVCLSLTKTILKKLTKLLCSSGL